MGGSTKPPTIQDVASCWGYSFANAELEPPQEGQGAMFSVDCRRMCKNWEPWTALTSDVGEKCRFEGRIFRNLKVLWSFLGGVFFTKGVLLYNLLYIIFPIWALYLPARR